jgi:hypothetical protein
MNRLIASATATLVITIAVLIPGTSALAGQPVTQTLNPPPPSFEPCKAVGSGTICSGTRTVAVNDDTGTVCGQGANAFDIVLDATVDQTASRTYDRDGNMTQRFIHDTYRSGLFVNSETGASVPFTGHDTVTDVLAIPADFDSATETIAGEFVVTLPHTGTVYLTAGRLVMAAADGTIDFRAGPGVLIEWFVNGGRPEAPAELCSALGSA